MKTFNIDDMCNGWFIGDFEPSACKNSNFEVAHHKHPAGYKTCRHTHKLAQELTYILRGKVNIRGETLVAGQMFLYEPMEIADAEIIEDVDLIVVKWPSVPSDKYLIDDQGNIVE